MVAVAALHAPILAALFVVAMWWLSTSLVLRLVWRGPSRSRLWIASVLGLAGLWTLHWSSAQGTVTASYIGFMSALVVWGWHELTFLLGIVTGPRRSACPVDARGFERFWLATSTLIHHELALLFTGIVVIAISWDAPNQVGVWTYEVLWVMRLSAKLNVFLGVRNLSVQLIPERSRYLASYFRVGRTNWLLPLCIAASSCVLFQLLNAALAADLPTEQRVQRMLPAVLLALAVLEHVVLALPLPDALLFRWATRVKRQAPVEQLRG
jgi:putative photosynthetic complex assembly protein 2